MTDHEHPVPGVFETTMPTKSVNGVITGEVPAQDVDALLAKDYENTSDCVLAIIYIHRGAASAHGPVIAF